jgi:hypothetical protein
VLVSQQSYVFILTNSINKKQNYLNCTAGFEPALTVWKTDNLTVNLCVNCKFKLYRYNLLKALDIYLTQRLVYQKVINKKIQFESNRGIQ